MISPWHLLVIFFAAGIAFAASVTYALVLDADGSSASARRATVSPTPASDRTNCDEIFGTAYRSGNERKWFAENCSAWSAAVGNLPESSVPVAEPPRGREPPSPSPDGRDCNQIRGTPYRSNAERDWYLRTCQVAANQQAASGPDRTDCNEIRGTPYRSDSERRWFQANCGSPQPAVVGGPDRTNCDEIRGTAYRSENERRWFQGNCGR